MGFMHSTPEAAVSWIGTMVLNIGIPTRKFAVYRIVIGQYLNHEGIVISHLNISSVRTSDGGVYKCVGSNSIGWVDHTARLNVYGEYSY